MSANTIEIVVPSRLTPNSELLAGISKRPERRNKASHFLSYLHTSKNDERKAGGFVTVSSQFSESIYTPQGYATIRNYLEQNGIVESDHRYRVSTPDSKGICKGWKISDHLNSDSIVCEISDPSLYKNLVTERLRTVKSYSKAVEKMERDLRMIGLPSDFAFDSFVKSLPEQVSEHARACLLGSVTKLRDSHSDITNVITKGAVGRYFHKLNNASKPLRKCVQMDGENTCEVDVTNCQPLLMASILGDSTMIKACCNGSFYETLLDASPVEMSREDMKKAALRDVIAKTPKNGHQYWEGKPADLAFKIAFPDAFASYERYRKKHGDLGMVHELQRLESEIIHDDALPLIQKADHLAVSIHDGIMTTTDSGEEISAILKGVFEGKLGTSCQITVTDQH